MNSTQNKKIEQVKETTMIVGIDLGSENLATVGLIMLLSRVFDGASDMVMGIIVEKTNSRWGKSRPWILWMSVPYALSVILLFTVPHTMGMV